jgi:hypothetical protein
MEESDNQPHTSSHDHDFTARGVLGSSSNRFMYSLESTVATHSYTKVTRVLQRLEEHMYMWRKAQIASLVTNRGRSKTQNRTDFRSQSTRMKSAVVGRQREPTELFESSLLQGGQRCLRRSGAIMRRLALRCVPVDDRGRVWPPYQGVAAASPVYLKGRHYQSG